MQSLESHGLWEAAQATLRLVACLLYPESALQEDSGRSAGLLTADVCP